MKLKSDDPSPKRTALASTKADLRELKSNSSATVKELQEFLRQLKGKSPQEMMGVVAASDLMRSLALSSSSVFGAILLFTAIPYFFGDEKKIEATRAKTSAPTAEPEKVVPEPEAKQDPLSSLGVGEELTAPPNENPLENKGDDFLKDLE